MPRVFYRQIVIRSVFSSYSSPSPSSHSTTTTTPTSTVTTTTSTITTATTTSTRTTRVATRTIKYLNRHRNLKQKTKMPRKGRECFFEYRGSEKSWVRIFPPQTELFLVFRSLSIFCWNASKFNSRDWVSCCFFSWKDLDWELKTEIVKLGG